MNNKKLSKTIRFELITDNRFDDNYHKEIVQIESKILKILNNPLFEFEKSKINYLKWESENIEQARITFWVKYDKSKITLEYLIRKVNEIKVCSYERQNSKGKYNYI